MNIEEIGKAIEEHFKEDFLGMTSNGKEMFVGIKEKEIEIKDYTKKTIEEIIEELEKASE